jgi:hypothetical protein
MVGPEVNPAGITGRSGVMVAAAAAGVLAEREMLIIMCESDEGGTETYVYIYEAVI